jgi:hypothetical protein
MNKLFDENSVEKERRTLYVNFFCRQLKQTSRVNGNSEGDNQVKTEKQHVFTTIPYEKWTLERGGRVLKKH